MMLIFHLAALARIQPSLKDPYKTIYNNFTSTLNILEYGRKNDIKVVYAGSVQFMVEHMLIHILLLNGKVINYVICIVKYLTFQ